MSELEQKVKKLESMLNVLSHSVDAATKREEATMEEVIRLRAKVKVLESDAHNYEVIINNWRETCDKLKEAVIMSKDVHRLMSEGKPVPMNFWKKELEKCST